MLSVLTRRAAMMSMGAGVIAPAHAVQAADFISRRPPPGERRFTSPAVEAAITAVKRDIGNAELAWMFENCFPNTLDTTVTIGERDGAPDTYVVTGDIDAMWLRDSSAQVAPYVRFCREDAALAALVRGVIARQARCILIDPYANAFGLNEDEPTRLPWAVKDATDMKPGVAERKWEIDSLCYPVRLADLYWQATGDLSPFDMRWRAAMRCVVDTFRVQQRKDGPGPYRFKRIADAPTESLAGDGYGVPVRPNGMIASMFRPSDDACAFPFLVPSNLFAVFILRRMAAIVGATGSDADLAADAVALAAEVEAATRVGGVIRLDDGETVWAYETDGFGNHLFMDDANVPGLLSLPYLGGCAPNDALYRRTRARVLSGANPWFFHGRAAEGIGGPHVGPRMIWPMSIIMRALTASDAGEIATCLGWLRTTHGGTGFMHEAFDQDDPSRFTRTWFAWANTLFGELVISLWRKDPGLLRG